MPRVVVVTDSTASLPTEVAQARGIRVVPLQVVIGARVLDEGPDGATPDVVAEALRDPLRGPEQRGLVDVAKVPSEKGPPRKVFSLNAQGRTELEEFWRTWGFLAERIEQLHTDIEQGK